MSKYLMKSAAAIVLGLAATACSHDFDYVEKVEQQSIDNAQQTLGFYIPENQDWKMSSEANVNVTIPGDANETYTVMIFSNNPLEDGIGYYLTKQTLNGGQNLATDVAYPMHLRSLVIGITDSNGKTIYKSASIDNGKVTALSDISAARTRARTRGVDYELKPVTPKYSEPDKPSFTSKATVNSRKPTISIEGYLTKADDVTATTSGIPAANTITDWSKATAAYLSNDNTSATDAYPVTLYVVDDITFGSNTDEGTVFVVTEGKTLTLTNLSKNAKIILAEGAILDMSKATTWDGSISFAGDQSGLYMSKDSQIKGSKVLFFDGCQVMNNNGTISITDRIQVDKNSILWNDGTFETVTTLHMENENSTVYNAKGRTLNATNITTGNNYGLLYNDGTVIATGDIDLHNTNAEFVNAGTLEAGSISLAAGGKFFNSDDCLTTIHGLTYITNMSAEWLNKGEYNTGDFTVYNAGKLYNDCKLTVHADASGTTGTFNFGGTTQNAFVIMANSSVKTDYFVLTAEGDMWMKENALLWITTKLTSSNLNPETGFHGTGNGYSFIKAADIDYESARRWRMNYFGKIYVDADKHFLQGFDNSNNPADQPHYYFDTDVKLKFAPHNDPCPITEPITGNCHHGYTPPGTTITEEPAVWSYAFEDNSVRCDFDMNDVVLRVNVNKDDDTKFDVTLVAAGCEYDNYVFLGNDTNPISWNGKTEVHDALGAAKGQMVNTGKGVTKTPVTVTIPRNGESANNAHFSIWPYKKGGEYGNVKDQKEDAAIPVTQLQGSGMAPLGIVVPGKWAWPKERICIVDAYSQFVEWATSDPYGANVKATDWYNHPNDDKVIK